MPEALLRVKDLRTCFHTADGTIAAVDGVSFHLDRGETLGLVGESGCGKSVTALSLLQLIPRPPGRIESGQVLFDGEDLLRMSAGEIRHIRGNRISMIFQEVMTSLNPVLRIGRQLGETIEVHQGLDPRQALDKAVDLLRLVGIPLPRRRIGEYPHQLSGGMRQRVMIAMAIACNPALLIADEPTTALDVTIQAQVLELMKELKRALGTAILIISHDLGLVAEMAQRVIVMYAGKIVEEAPVEALFADPRHPYTRGLLASIPNLTGGRGQLSVIEGSVPLPGSFPAGCRFHPRCPVALPECSNAEPPLVDLGGGRQARCWLCADRRLGGSGHE
jgi:oligopeptide transport system ATP-binding protein